MNDSEQLASHVLGSIFPDAEIRLREDQHHSIHDFDIVKNGAIVAAVEVTTAADADRIKSYAVIDKQRKQRPIPARLAAHIWRVHPEGGFSMKLLHADLDRMLAAVEAEGLTQFFSQTSADSPAVLELWSKLKIEAGEVLRATSPRVHSIAYPSGATIVDGQDAVDAVLAEASKPDNLFKLRNASAPRKILLAVVDTLNYPAWKGLTDDEPPTAPQALPAGVDTIIAVARIAKDLVVWTVDANTTWRAQFWLSDDASQRG